MNFNTQTHIISQAQKECLVNFLEDHDYLVQLGRKGKPIDVEKNSKGWKELASLLNSKMGPRKTVHQWKETFNELKAKARARASVIEKQSLGPEANQTEKHLSPLEHRLLVLTSNQYLQSLVRY
ncbi:unnamed protein product [Phyllotreta striolata]|uniref:Regulatory protein zeste n=1 Tax=Phyllotreta striolata TaxID=444603 RepID=A0A9N9TUK9_PHYSR|nr:unnamed protein product [Phyllotreta striolata]